MPNMVWFYDASSSTCLIPFAVWSLQTFACLMILNQTQKSGSLKCCAAPENFSQGVILAGCWAAAPDVRDRSRSRKQAVIPFPALERESGALFGLANGTGHSQTTGSIYRHIYRDTFPPSKELQLEAFFVSLLLVDKGYSVYAFFFSSNADHEPHVFKLTQKLVKMFTTARLCPCAWDFGTFRSVYCFTTVSISVNWKIQTTMFSFSFFNIFSLMMQCSQLN